MADATPAVDPAATPAAAEAVGWEAPDVVGLIFAILFVLWILSKCFRKSTTAEAIAPLRTFLSMMDTDDSGVVDKEEFWEEIAAEKEMKIVYAGDTKEMAKSAYRSLETEKKNKISWYEFLAFVEKRVSKASASKKGN
jgi:hypothetical protein